MVQSLYKKGNQKLLTLIMNDLTLSYAVTMVVVAAIFFYLFHKQHTFPYLYGTCICNQDIHGIQHQAMTDDCQPDWQHRDCDTGQLPSRVHQIFPLHRNPEGAYEYDQRLDGHKDGAIGILESCLSHFQRWEDVLSEALHLRGYHQQTKDTCHASDDPQLPIQ